MRISYDLEERFAKSLAKRAKARGVPVEALAHQIVLEYLDSGEPGRYASLVPTHSGSSGSRDATVPNSLQDVEGLDWSEEAPLARDLMLHQAEIFALGE